MMKKILITIISSFFIGIFSSINAQELVAEAKNNRSVCNENTTEFNKDNKENQQRHLNGKARYEEFARKKREFFIKEVGMTKDEENQFFPLYDELQSKKFELQKALRQKFRAIDEAKDKATNEMYTDAAEQMVQIKLKEAELENEYFKKFQKILSPEKLYKLQFAELRFNMEMMRKNSKDKPKDN